MFCVCTRHVEKCSVLFCSFVYVLLLLFFFGGGVVDFFKVFDFSFFSLYFVLFLFMVSDSDSKCIIQY